MGGLADRAAIPKAIIYTHVLNERRARPSNNNRHREIKSEYICLVTGWEITMLMMDFYCLTLLLVLAPDLPNSLL